MDRYGSVDADAVERTIGGNTTLVTIMHANNEVGTLQPIRAIAHYAKARGVLVHTDAAQSLGKVPVDVNELGVDLLSIMGHKLYAPERHRRPFTCARGSRSEPFIHGAGHGNGRRAGTENVPYIVGLGKACEIIKNQSALPQRMETLRDRLFDRLHQALGDRIVDQWAPGAAAAEHT